MTVQRNVNLNIPVMTKKCIIFLVMTMFPFLSCHKEEIKGDKPTGKLKIEIGLYVSVSEEFENLKSAMGTEDFKVIIYNAAGDQVLEFEKAADMPEEIQLETGNYYVAAFSDNDLPAAFENPYYYGKSENFTITPNNPQTVVVNCELGNTIVSVIYSDNVKNYFSDFTTTVSSASGSLTYVKDETRSGYFKPLPLAIHAVLTWQGPDGILKSKTLTGSIADPKPKRKYEIHVSASAGGASSNLLINLDESSGPVEIVDINDSEHEAEGDLKSGDLLITEIMYDPTALADAAGEWFEIYNTTDQTLNLQNLVVEKNGTDRHIINESITLSPKSYLVLSRTENAVAGNYYVYGTGISLNNAGAILSVSNYGTDGTDGTTICSVDYGAQDFPSATGASICLNPLSLNTQGETSAASWCVSTSVYSTGDMGTPGVTNDNCN
jgi:hypothetical protein